MIKQFYCPGCNTTTDFTMYENGKHITGECIRCDNYVKLNDDGIWEHEESEHSFCPECWEDDKDIDEQPQFKKQEWHACQDGDMYYIQSDPEDEHYIASFKSESAADNYCEYLNSKEVNECEECGLKYEDHIKDQPLGEEGYFHPHICECGNKCLSERCTKCGKQVEK